MNSKKTRAISTQGQKLKMTVFIDESGTLPDPKDKVIVVAAVGTHMPKFLAEINKTIRKRIKSSEIDKAISEIKFHQAS